MDKFDFDDFRARFDDAMEAHMARDKELVEEYKRVASVSKVFFFFFFWATVVGLKGEKEIYIYFCRWEPGAD